MVLFGQHQIPFYTRAIHGLTVSQDVAFYGLSQNSSIFLKSTGYSDGADLYHKLYNTSIGLIILSVAGSIPGYWTAVFAIDTIGRKPLQIFGFLALTPLFCALGFASHRLTPHAMLALYIIAQFLFNLGPNTTTFIVPGECYPTRYRTTGHGLSAAAGKVGAIVAQVISLPLLAGAAGGSTARPDRLMRLFALSTLCGVFASLLIPETKGITLEELAGEPPTSYNSGRNGSVSVRPSSLNRRWNVFVGCQPAGFMYPRAGGMRRVWRRSPRAGPGSSSSSSPEMAAAVDPAEAERSALGGRAWWRSRRGHQSVSRKGYGLSSSTSSTRPINSPSGGGVPAWNAGWGRIDRGAPAPDNIRLQDVGGLIDE